LISQLNDSFIYLSIFDSFESDSEDFSVK